MEKHTRALTAVMLSIFALLLGGGLLLGGCQPEHLSYCVAFALSIPVVALFVRWQKQPRRRASVWDRLGAGRTAALLLALCFAVNLAWVLSFRLDPDGDYATYWQSAKALAGFGDGNWRYVALFPHILGYSAFLSVFLRIFGPSALVAPVLNVCLTTLSGYFLFRLCLRWRGLNQAAFALLLWALLPSKLFYNAMVLSEPYYTCLLLAALLIISGVEARRPAPVAAALLGLLAGLLLRLMQTARPIAPVPIIALLLWLVLLRSERTAEARRRWLRFTALLLAAYLATGPLWAAFEERTLGEKPARLPAYSIYVGLNPVTLGSYSDEDMTLLIHYRLDEEDSSAIEAQSHMLEETKARLASGEVPIARLLLRKLRNFLGYDEGGAFYSRAGLRDRAYQLLALGSNICYYALGILALVGCWYVYSEGERRTLLLAPLYVIGLTLAQLLVEVAARYHYSVLPMLIILAACACNARREKLSS